jgi:hypothetical protein
MTRSMVRLVYQLIATCMLFGTASRVDAGPTVTVSFSGTGTTATGSSATFTGYFAYDEGRAGTASPGGGYTYDYAGAGNGVVQKIYYKIGSQVAVTATGAAAEPFKITTSGFVFDLLATAQSNTVYICLPTNVNVGAYATLPCCTTASGQAVFPPTALVGSTFKVTTSTSGATQFTGTITQTSCTSLNCTNE